MRQMQVCAQGHRWDPEQDARPDLAARLNVCPFCGGSVEMVSIRDTAGDGSRNTEKHRSPPLPPSDPGIPGFDILSVLGYGGMGVVYKARQEPTGRLVALKMLSAGIQARPGDQARFEREAEAISRLSHPHIVPVIAVGRHNGLPYVALEFMDRGSLADAITDNPLMPARAAELVEILARAVQAAHDAGIIHRDLKPANVLLASPVDVSSDHPAVATLNLLGVPKVADFGLAKRIDDEGAQTRTGAIMGTPGYMAPEQATGKSRTLGPSCDIWALGAILYECLTGRVPFQGATVLETLDQVRSIEPPAPSSLRADIPAELETICLKCLRKHPSDRYASATDLADDLRRYLDGKPILARPVPLWQRAGRWLTRHGVALSLGLLTLASLATALWLWQRRSGTNKDARDQITTAYYSNFVKRWGVPEGIGELSEKQVAQRQLSYRFTLRDGQVEKVEAIDRRGQLTPRHPVTTYLEGADSRRLVLSLLIGQPDSEVLGLLRSRLGGGRPLFGGPAPECSWDYQHDGEGNLAKEIARDSTGRIVWTFQLTSKTTGHYTDQRGFALTRAGSGASYVELVHDDDGLEKEVRYRGRTGKPRPDVFGTFGRRFTHDERGLVTEVTFLGANDQPVLHPSGYARVTRQWNERGQLTEEAYFDLRGQPARGEFGAARLRWRHDALGNPVAQEALDLDGKKTTGTLKLTYDPKGHLLAWEVDPTVKPGPSRRASRRVYEYRGDECVGVRYFDSKGKPYVDPFASAAGVAFTYKDGRITEVTYLDAGGKPAPAPVMEPNRPDRPNRPERPDRSPRKEVRAKLDYTTAGQVKSLVLFGLDGKRISDRLGVARYEYTYDDAGRLTEIACFDPDGKPVVCKVFGMPAFARQVRKYDDQGRLEELASYDGEGMLVEPVVPSEPGPFKPSLSLFLRSISRSGLGFFPSGRLVLTSDERGNVTRIVLQGVDDQPATDADGISRIDRVYDDLGNLLEESNHDTKGKLKAGPSKVARTRWGYDGLGNLTEIATYGSDGKLVESTHKVARHTRRYDSRYNLTEEAFQGADGLPTLGKFGYARAQFTYDREGDLRASVYLDLDAKAVPTRIVWLYRTTDTGLKLDAGDVFLTYDGKQVSCARLFAQVKRQEKQGGQPKELRVERAGKPVSLRIPAGPLRGEDFFPRLPRSGFLFEIVPGSLEPFALIQTRARTHLELK